MKGGLRRLRPFRDTLWERPSGTPQGRKDQTELSGEHVRKREFSMRASFDSQDEGMET